MSRTGWVLVLWLTAIPASFAAQAPRSTHLGYVYPAGGRQGARFEVEIGGQYLNDIRRAYVSGTGVQAVLTEQVQPPDKTDATQLRQRMAELLRELRRDSKGGKNTADKEKELAAIRKKLSAQAARRSPTPAIAECATLQVTVAPDAAPGPRELRVEAAQGLSNPLVFHVGRLPEYCEPVLPVAVETMARGGRRGVEGPLSIVETPEDPLDGAMEIALPATVNGQIMPFDPNPAQFRRVQQFLPGDVDRYRFQARKGQQLVAVVSARALVPYVADAVPGWMQATLALCDATGKELAYSDDFRFHPDPVLFCKIPADGQYMIEIKDAIYRGRADFVYRITIGELPFITSVFPLGGPAGTATKVELTGWNLSTIKLTIDAKDKALGVYPLSLRNGELLSNTMPFTVDSLPECLEKESNSTPQIAQRVTLPMIVNGRVDQPGDWDVFRFEGRAGEQVVAEVHARRLESPLDSVLRLTDAAGKELAFNEDHEDKGSGLHTHHADSFFQAALPADGTYYVHLGDSQRQGGPEYAYRLRLSPPRPDFELRVAPSSINARSRGTAVTVFALRKEGFAGEIALGLKDAPEGFTLRGSVPADKDQAQVTFTTPRVDSEESITHAVYVEGRATIAGQEVVRTAVPAEDMMQAFAYHHLTPAQELKVAALGRFVPRGRAGAKTEPGKMAVRLLAEQPVKIPAGGTAPVRFSVRAEAAAKVKGQVELELSDPPAGVTLENVSLAPEVLTFTLRGDAAKVKPGLTGNLLVKAFAKSSVTFADGKKQEVRNALGTLPAIPFEIVKP